MRKNRICKRCYELINNIELDVLCENKKEICTWEFRLRLKEKINIEI